jgi:hypothetical protein
MKNKIAITILLCLICDSLSSQSWIIDYRGDYPSGRTHFNSGFVDEDGVTFLAGVQGPDHESHETLLMRIEPNGEHQETVYHKDGFISEAHCIIETDDHHLFVAGRIYDENDDDVMILLFDKDLRLLSESRYSKEVEAINFDQCNATLDAHGNIIVASGVKMNNPYGGTVTRGVFYKFNRQGELLCYRYLTEDYPDPVYFLMRFRIRQMWYREEDETLLCLTPGSNGGMAFVTFDSAFNYLEEYPIWREADDTSFEHTLNHDCYTDHWITEDEALFFSSQGDYDHNKLRISQVNTRGEFTKFIQLNERPDTIDDAATRRCMATANDSTFYFSFYEHQTCCIPGTAVVYLLNEKMEIIGRHIDEQHDAFRSYLIFPTSDGGCITVNDSCDLGVFTHFGHPKITKLRREDFETVHLNAMPIPREGVGAFPNPTEHTLFIPLNERSLDRLRCRIIDLHGRVVIDQIVPANQDLLLLDVSLLKKGTYVYRIYTSDSTTLSGKFTKK